MASSAQFEITPRMLDALAAAHDAGNSASAIARLTKNFGEQDARWAVTQWELRRRAKEKFVLAEQMLFTRAALEMATHERVAEYHASLFPKDKTVADLTCGIGADLIALAKRGSAVGYDINLEHVVYARHNLDVHGLEAEIIVADATDFRTNTQYIYADPARRRGDKRVSADEFSPSLDALRPITADAVQVVIKLSPMLPDDFIVELGGRREFISYGGECRELLLHYPGDESQTFAVHIESGSKISEEEIYYSKKEPESYFYEADPAAIRAHCLGTFEMSALGDSNGYLTSSHLVVSPWLRSFEVLWQGAWRVKAVKEVLMKNQWKPVAVKKRGVDIDPVKVMKELRGLSGEEAVIAVYPVGAKAQAVILKKL